MSFMRFKIIKAIMGEMSIPPFPNGIMILKRFRKGSVTFLTILKSGDILLGSSHEPRTDTSIIIEYKSINLNIGYNIFSPNLYLLNTSFDFIIYSSPDIIVRTRGISNNILFML